MTYQIPAVRRVEAAEILSARESTLVAMERFPDLHAALLDVGGGVAAFHGIGSPLTHVVGPWITATANPADLDAVEAFYAERNSPVNVEYSTLADPAGLELLSSRGYRLVEMNHVLVRELPGTIPEAWLDTKLSVAGPEQHELWARTMVEGFVERQNLTWEERILGLTLAPLEGCRPWMAWVDGQPAATGALLTRYGLAHLFCDSTLPAFRGKGLQSALIWCRIVDAVRSGCDLATASTLPGSQSQRNYERMGFRVSYARLNFQKG